LKNYLAIIFDKFQLIPFVSFLFAIFTLEITNYNHYLILYCSIFFAVTAALFLKKIGENQRFEPLQIMLSKTGVTSSYSGLNVISLSVLVWIFLILAMFPWLYLSVYGGLSFFSLGLVAFSLVILAFYSKLELYYRGFNNLFVIIGLGLLPYLSVIEFHKSELSIYDYNHLLSLCFLSFVVSGIDSLMKLNLDYQYRRKSLIDFIGELNFKVLLTISLFLLYINQVAITFYTENIWYLLPLFSVTFTFNLMIKVFSKKDASLEKPLIFAFISLFFHSSLQLASEYMVINSNV
jgi:1,4-dihydroxy-2-naphthoate octaprenyltransferase